MMERRVGLRLPNNISARPAPRDFEARHNKTMNIATSLLLLWIQAKSWTFDPL